MVDFLETNVNHVLFQPSPSSVETFLTHGMVSSVSGRNIYKGPCLLPNNGEKLLAHYINGDPPRILEIQAEDADCGSLNTARLMSVTDDDYSGR